MDQTTRILALTAVLMILIPTLSIAANYYVTPSGAGSRDGSSWANAATLQGVNPTAGSTVFIDGGSSSQTYDISGGWAAKGGNSQSPVYYKVSQESGRSGIVKFDMKKAWNVFYPANYVDFDGNVNGERHMQFINPFTPTVSNPTWLLSETNGGATGQAFRYIEFNGGILMSGIVGDAYGNGNGHTNSGIEFDHCKWNPVNWVNRQLFIQGSGSTVTAGYIHDCEFEIVRDIGSSYTGDDGIAAGHVIIENNRFIDYPIASGTYIGQGGQHQDYIQGANGYMRINNNYFEGADQYCVYGEFRFDGGNLQVYNNVFVNCAYNAIANGPTVNTDANSCPLEVRYISDMLVANNLVINSGIGISVNDPYRKDCSISDVAKYSNTRVYNNIIVTGGGRYDFSGTSTGEIINSNNLENFATSNFVNFAGGDYHLMSSSSARNAGRTLTEFSIDKDGVTRPQEGAWDIGPYEYYVSGPTNGACGTAARTYAQGDTFPGTYTLCSAGTPPTTTPTLGASAGATATWTCAGINGGTSATCNATRSSTLNGACGPAAKAYSETETFPAGAYCSAGTASPSSPANPAVGSSTTWTCAGSNGGTNVTCIASRAVILTVTPGTPVTFSVSTAGVYKLVGSVSAPDDGANSFYVDIDANPGTSDNATGTPRIWDILPYTTGFQDRDVTWRGSGTFDNPQFSPKNWTLSAGTHTLYVNVRESRTQIQSISLVRLGASLNYHPADTGRDWALSTGEVSIYNLCWKTPTCTPSPATTYVSNANLMWKSRADGAYRYAGGTCPLCWVSGA